MRFSKEEIKRRRITRLAEIIHDHWEEGSGMDTRFFDHPFIHNEHVMSGRSVNGGTYREHVVPRVYLRDECLKLLDQGRTIDDLAEVLMNNLLIVTITNDEADNLNKMLKDRMP